MARDLIEVDEARSLVLGAVQPLPSEPVAIRDALGRVLAEDAVAAEPVPGYDGSAMDGFALISADTNGASAEAPALLRIVDESRAGWPAKKTLGQGEAIAISTGAMVPAGADAVIRVEDTDPNGNQVGVRVEVPPENDIRRAGEDIQPGRMILGHGNPIGAVELGVLASINRPEVACARRPTVGIVATGDELLEPGEPGREGGVRSSNGYVLPALATLAGAEVAAVGHAPDQAQATEAALSTALESDVVVISGGVSVGDHDHVRGSLERLAVEQVFWGIALRPGKPTFFGVAPASGDGPQKLVFGLPGNPVSALVTFLLFVRPALRAMQGADASATRTKAILTAQQPRMERRTQAVRCALEAGEQGWLATPTGPQGSHILTSLLGADGLAIIEPGRQAADAGEQVEVELLAGLGGRAERGRASGA